MRNIRNIKMRIGVDLQTFHYIIRFALTSIYALMVEIKILIFMEAEYICIQSQDYIISIL